MEKLFVILFGVVLVIGLFTLSSWVFQLLWNWVVVGVFSAPIISLLQAMGIVGILSFVGGMFSK